MTDTKTPDEAAKFLMERFRPYLPEREREELGRLVVDLMDDWANLVEGVAMESGER
jgi:hypothetical protein